MGVMDMTVLIAAAFAVVGCIVLLVCVCLGASMAQTLAPSTSAQTLTQRVQRMQRL